MSVLASLVRACERMGADAPPFGYARTNVSFAIRIDKAGTPTCAPIDLREPSGKGKKLIGPKKELPTFLVQRTSGIDANFLWTKTQYSLELPKLIRKRALRNKPRMHPAHLRCMKLSSNCIERTLQLKPTTNLSHYRDF